MSGRHYTVKGIIFLAVGYKIKKVISIGQCMFLFSSKSHNHVINTKEDEIKYIQTVVLLVILYDCEGWSITVTDEHHYVYLNIKFSRRNMIR